MTTNEIDNDRILEFALCDPAFSRETPREALDRMVHGYLEAMLWAGLDDHGYSAEDVPDAVVDMTYNLFEDLVLNHPLSVRMYRVGMQTLYADVWAQFGHDFLLTRDGHGAGFWDRGLGDLGDYLTELTRPYGCTESLFITEDGRLTL